MTRPRDSRNDHLSRPSCVRVCRGVPLLVLLALSACGQQQNTGGLTIAVIPKGTSHVFWQSIHAGAEKAAREIGATIIWRGPLREDDRASQVSEVEGFVSRGVSGIVLAPLDEAALARPVADATHRKIPVVDVRLRAQGQTITSASSRPTTARAAGWRASTSRRCSDGRQGRHAPLRRGVREHAAARSRVSRSDRRASRDRGRRARTSTAAPMSRARTRRARRCSAATSAPTERSASTASSRPNESTTLRDAARPRRTTAGRAR